MNQKHNTQQLNRRTFLRGAGVAIALPFFESILPAATTGQLGKTAARRELTKRLVCIGNPYGMIPHSFFPKETGLNYVIPSLLKPLEKHKNEFSVFSNFDHGISGGHRTVNTYLTGVKTKDAKAMPDGNISIDQMAAEHVGFDNRFPSLNMGVGGGCEMSWTRSGVNVPVLKSAREVYRKLFIDEKPATKKRKSKQNRIYASILDVVNDQAHELNKRLGKRDQEKLDEYLTSIRGMENRIGMSKHWVKESKPKVDMKEPEDAGFSDSLSVFYDLMFLALQTNSTRVATLEMPETFNTTALGLNNSYHTYSHHGLSPERLKGLTVIEKFQNQELSKFIDKLKATTDPDGKSMFENTIVLSGSGMGNGSSHSNKNLPILLAGGGFKHQGHVKLPEEKRKRIPLCNLYLSILQQFGMEIDRFGVSTGTLNGYV